MIQSEFAKRLRTIVDQSSDDNIEFTSDECVAEAVHWLSTETEFLNDLVDCDTCTAFPTIVLPADFYKIKKLVRVAKIATETVLVGSGGTVGGITFNVTDGTKVIVGATVIGAAFQANTTVLSVLGNAVTISKPLTAVVSGNVTFCTYTAINPQEFQQADISKAIRGLNYGLNKRVSTEGQRNQTEIATDFPKYEFYIRRYISNNVPISEIYFTPADLLGRYRMVYVQSVNPSYMNTIPAGGTVGSMPSPFPEIFDMAITYRACYLYLSRRSHKINAVSKDQRDTVLGRMREFERLAKDYLEKALAQTSSSNQDLESLELYSMYDEVPNNRVYTSSNFIVP
jgi:hypothetical protein